MSSEQREERPAKRAVVDNVCNGSFAKLKDDVVPGVDGRIARRTGRGMAGAANTGILRIAWNIKRSK